MTNKSQMRKFLWAKFIKLPFIKKGRHGREEDDHQNSLMSTSNVNEEYKQAFRTKSYIEIREKVQCQLEISCDLHQEQYIATSSSSSSSPNNVQYDLNLCEFLLHEPHDQESLISSNLHEFLVNYFEISHEISRICETLLTDIHRVRDDHRSMRNVITSIQRVPSGHENLASSNLHKNPFSKTALPQKFQELHNSHILLLHDLTSHCKKKKTKRQKRVNKFFKRAVVGYILMGFGALAAALLVLMTMHCMVGFVAAPILGIWALGRFMKKRARRKRDRKRLNKGLVAKLDTAARGVFIIMNDFETMGPIVKRLHDEMEHGRFVADIIRVRKLGENHEMLKEIVVREFHMHDSCLMEQLDELEKQIYLCFLDINRSRRLLVREMVKY
ncbi:hypothetical protein OROGR_016568 [Orobanche gracilis]